jgi:ribosomal protein S18 acetylase RimI-like enzyme
MKFKIELVAPELTWNLRHRVLRPTQEIYKVQYAADKGAGAFHVGARVSEPDGAQSDLVGTATFQVEAHKDFSAKLSYRLRGMATDPKYRGAGIGRELLLKSFEELELRGCDFLWCNAREAAFGFYEKLGFRYHGEMFGIEDIGPHKVMYKHLASG